jgi:hypothetical protein
MLNNNKLEKNKIMESIAINLKNSEKLEDKMKVELENRGEIENEKY